MNLPRGQDNQMLPDEAFVEMVRDALGHLYDYPHLQTHPLVDRLGPRRSLGVQQRGRFLHTAILRTVEELHPGAVPFRSAHARTYNVLNLHYIEGLTVQEVARELSISERQCYRDLRKAEEDLAAMFWAGHVWSGQATREEADVPTREDIVLEEAERLSPEMEEVEVTSLVEGVLDSVRALAGQRGVQISVDPGKRSVVVRADRLLARQALLSALSYAVRMATVHTVVRLSARSGADGAQIEVQFKEQDPGKDGREPLAVAGQLARRAGGEWLTAKSEDGQTRLVLVLGRASRARVLVIDDNAGLIELFQRYLVGEDYEVLCARDGQEGLQLAGEHTPDIIVLDIMMPQQDGWEILQRLKNQDKTKRIPVIVCSVLNDPELAFSLGACEFLTKPVTRDQLLATLKHCQ